MSKIGKINISIPEKVKVVLAGSIINIEGPLGKKSVDIDLEMFNLDIKEGKEISIKPKKIDQNSKRLWGMNRSLINNAVGHLDLIMKNKEGKIELDLNSKFSIIMLCLSEYLPSEAKFKLSSKSSFHLT